ncbi:DUF3592 domain-containing protein [Spirilliplanes yamanashiensis]|uniref:DUF3592 domain-containing protein n=1 Tax=Spirilliplanes yamanashiensis TaxID=42233 RepID=A0A8J3Y9I3_9ACTN|nr:DUF3592 domain-containing protein [Spirilliplanes yamanashiensis]MDP9815740.1 hypothetical protein [Spirilliplanes yamanashiensis]GIJ03994.1 hypothetical protein Sya03_33460 [Spirilliplanes yamanashiensis]
MDIGLLHHLVGGVLTGAGGIHLLRGAARAARRGEVRSVGKVVDFQPRDSGQGLWYAPIVAFVDESGAKREFTDDFATRAPLHHAGEAVRVTYPPGRPGDARVDSARHTVWTVAVPLAMAALFLTVSLALLVPIGWDALQ